MTNDERKPLERARATLDTLTPATARDDAIMFDLRYAEQLFHRPLHCREMAVKEG